MEFTVDGIGYNNKSIKGGIQVNKKLLKHTTWKVGGCCDVYFTPKDIQDLQCFLKLIQPKKHNILWLGLGSNVLIRDGGFKGIVINTVGQMKQIEVHMNEQSTGNVLVSAQSGVTCAKFSREISSKGISGAEFFSGIPGSMGGAIAMNAGAFGGECWDNLSYVETINRQGVICKRDKKDFEVSYRSVKGLKSENDMNSEWFIKGFFNFIKDTKNTEIMKQKIKTLLKQRNEKQPVQLANAGSVFKNPKGDFAARLIESCGLKNTTIGKAMVSQKHANFIINKGGASANDIESLMALIQKQVHKKFNIHLTPEVKIYGQH